MSFISVNWVQRGGKKRYKIEFESEQKKRDWESQMTSTKVLQ